MKGEGGLSVNFFHILNSNVISRRCLASSWRGFDPRTHGRIHHWVELRSWWKNRGSEDRDSHDRPITRDRNDRKWHLMYKHYSTQISIARTTVTACHRSQRYWFQFRKTTKCFEHDKVYVNVNYRHQTSINPENQRTNTEIIAILIWFLGICALPFLFRWASTTCALWRMFNSGTNRTAVHSELVAAHVMSRDFAVPWLYLCWTCVTVYNCIGPAKQKWQRTGS